MSGLGGDVRFYRTVFVEETSRDYVRTARAQGLPTRTIILRHALKPALLPVVSYVGPATAAVITANGLRLNAQTGIVNLNTAVSNLAAEVWLTSSVSTSSS